MLPDYNYVSLDLPSIASMAEENPDAFFEKYKMPVIIDEVQYAPKLFRFLKAYIDQDRHLSGQIVLIGSQKFELMKDLSESLAGRTAVLELEGLSWNEYKNAPCFSLENSANFEMFIFRGGFPELTREKDMPLDMFFSSYLATYLERGVRQIVNVSNLRIFEQFIRLLAVRNSQQLDMTEIANAIEITSKTIASWISVLETSGQISLLQPWAGNSGKRIVKTPKVYFNDTGLLCWLLGMNPENLQTSPFAGAIFETAVFAEIRKQNKLSGNKKQLYYYRDIAQTEVDFLVIGGGCKMIEAKLTANIKSEDARGIKKLKENLTSLLALPAEFIPLDCCIACTVPADFPFHVTTSVGSVDVTIMNIKNIAQWV